MVELILVPLLLIGGTLFLWLLFYFMRVLEYDPRRPNPTFNPLLDKLKAYGAIIALSVIAAIAAILGTRT